MDYLQYKKGVICMSTKINVLNLIINGLPSIHIQNGKDLTLLKTGVLNLIINGLPSIPV